MRIAYLFTTFPVQTETFLRREIRAMREREDFEIEIWSLWGGDPEWEGIPIHRYPFHRIFIVIFCKIALWTWRRPGVLKRVWKAYMSASPPSLMNIGENLLGLAFALDNASRFRAARPDLIHSVWGTMPAAAAWLLHELTGIPFSTGAHAYDIFQNDGDWTLPAKLLRAKFIHTTTQSARDRILELCPTPEKVHLIRRGFKLPLRPVFDSYAEQHKQLPKRGDPTRPLRIISVGRLVQKKGYFGQLALFRALLDAGENIEARIVGEGPLLVELQRHAALLNLENIVTFCGSVAFAKMRSQYDWSDLFFFTGIVANDGDRDGLPNVIPEAMSYGVPVLTTAVSGTTEAIQHSVTGLVLPFGDSSTWIHTIQYLRENPSHLQQIRLSARLWTEREFNSDQNTETLAQILRQSTTV